MDKNTLQCLECELKAQYIRHTQFAGSHPLCEKHAKKDPDFMSDDSDNGWEIVDNEDDKPL